MATTAEEVFDVFLSLINDYSLTSLFTTSGSENFNTYLQPWLLFSNQALTNVGATLTYVTDSQSYTTTLASEEILILAQVMVRYWMSKQVNNVLQMENILQDRDFKRHSAAQNLDKKTEVYSNKIEEVEQLLGDYAYKNNAWTNWENQSY